MAASPSRTNQLGRLSERDEVAVPCRLSLASAGRRWRRSRRIEVDALVVDVSITGAGLVLAADAETSRALSIGAEGMLHVGDSQGPVRVRHLRAGSAGGELRVGLVFSGELEDLLGALEAAAITSGVRGTLDERESAWKHAH